MITHLRAWEPRTDLHKIMPRERRGLMLTLAWAILFLVVGLAVALIATHHTGKLVGLGLSLLGIFILALYIFRRKSQPTKVDNEKEGQ
jgi:Flp pilus assembly protein TadB